MQWCGDATALLLYRTLESQRQGMGRRAADLTTPVPVLGVPALAGVRGWRTTAGDRSLLQTWGRQRSVCVQTSPGISRPPTQYRAQLTEMTLSTPSDNTAQTPESYAEETEHKEILQLRESDNEKRAILKQKSTESRTKKEVTFKTLGCETSQDVYCGGNHCRVRAIDTNPHFAGNIRSVRPKFKSSSRYTNGSVVDSEAMGGISVDGNDAEPAKSANSHRRNQTRLQGHHADARGKTLLRSAARPFRMPQKDKRSHSGGRQSVTTGVVTLAEKCSAADGYLREKGHTSLLTATCFQKPLRETNLKPESVTDRDKRTHFTAHPHLPFISEEVKCRKPPHPPCPVHSISNFVTGSQTHAASDTTSGQPTSLQRAKTISVITATTETRQDDSSTNIFFAKPSRDGKIAQPTSLRSTQTATATQANNPHSHTYPKRHEMPRHDVPRNVCVSIHVTPPPSRVRTTAAVPGNTPVTNPHETTTAVDTPLMSTECTPAGAQYETLQVHAARANVATNATRGPQMGVKCPTASLAAGASGLSHNEETNSQTNCLGPQCTSRDPGHKAREKRSSNIDSRQPGKENCTDALMNSAGSPHPPLSTQSTLCHISDPVTHTSTRRTSVAAQIHLIQAKCSNSEPTPHDSAASSNANLDATKPLDSRAALLSRAAPVSPCSSTLYQSVALRNPSVFLNNPLPTAAASSTLTENRRHLCASGTASPDSADTTRQSKEGNEAAHASRTCLTQATDSRSQIDNESSICVVFNRENNSTTTPVVLSELCVSKHHNGGSDARNTKSTIIPDNESHTDKTFNSNLIDDLVVHESKQHGNSNVSPVTSHQSSVSLRKSSSPCLQGCINTKQQRPAHHQGCPETPHVGHCDTSPPVKTGQETQNTETITRGSVRCGNVKLTCKSSAERKTHPNNQTPFVTTQTNSEPVISSRENSSVYVGPITESSAHKDTSSPPHAHRGPEIHSTPMAPLHSKGERCTHTGPEWEFISASSTKPPASLPHLQSRKGEERVRQDSKFGPARPQSGPQDSSLAHSHPAAAAPRWPPSPQCCKSATLQQRIETVEASLAANKDRITTLLDIIHELEMCHTPTSSRCCYKTGQDLKNCSTCQKTACIIYSVEYDFRQQERWLMEVLNRSAKGNNAFSVLQPLDFSLIRNIIIKNLKKSKMKSSKLCKTLFKLLPRKSQRVDL